MNSETTLRSINHLAATPELRPTALALPQPETAHKIRYFQTNPPNSLILIECVFPNRPHPPPKGSYFRKNLDFPTKATSHPENRPRTYGRPSSACHDIVFELTNILMHEALRRFKAEFFQALAHPTRIAIVELLRDGELSAGALIERLGVEQANASQHLTVLRSKHILVNRKVGNQVFYSVRNPLILDVLDIMKRYFYAHLAEGQAMFDEIKTKPATEGPPL
jgi:DNA-binding transcriptional ArsR family regulator